MSYKSSRLLATSLIGIFSLIGLNSSFAQTSTDDFLVTATVSDACTVSAGDYDFGEYNTLTPSIVNQNLTTLDVTCTLLTSFEVGLDFGDNNDNGQRRMINQNSAITSSNLLNYNFACAAPTALPGGTPAIVLLSSLVDTGCLTAWGNDSGARFVGVGLGPIALPLPLIGAIPAGQEVANGSYLDTVTATITY